MLEICKFGFDVLEFDYACNYISDKNSRTI